MAPIYHLCSHIQNSSLRNMPKIAVPYSKTFRAITQILYDEGLIQGLQIGDNLGPFTKPEPLTNLNVSKRRIWIDLKYRKGEPAINKMGIISKPSRRVFASPEELVSIAGLRSSNPLLKNQTLGQVTILNTPYGIIELKEALKKQVGGEVLCYVR
jgi:small subunit ribosomal protein S8